MEKHPEARGAAPLYLLRQDLLDWGCEDLPDWMPAPVEDRALPEPTVEWVIVD